MGMSLPLAGKTALVTGGSRGIVRAAGLTALRRLGTPSDVAAVIAFLAGPDSAWITGQNIHAGGGFLI
jgi:3-oxoacyl-[acyl-carrier protein] reductase